MTTPIRYPAARLCPACGFTGNVSRGMEYCPVCHTRFPRRTREYDAETVRRMEARRG